MKTKDKIAKLCKEKKFCKIYRKLGKDLKGRTTGIILDFSNDFILMQEINDFDVDGFAIFPLETVSEISFGNNEKHYNKILTSENIFPEIKNKYKINLKNWETIFKSIHKTGLNVIIENEIPDDETFDIGPIMRVTKSAVFIKYFNAEGILNEDVTKIKWNQITIVQFDNRYINVFSKYLREKKSRK